MLGNLFRRALTVFFGDGASKIILLAFELSLARLAGPASYGLFAICMAALFVLSNLCLIGTNFAAVQYLAIYQEQKRAERAAYLIRLTLSLVFAVGAVVGLLLAWNARWLSETLFHKPALGPLLALTALVLPFETVNQAAAAIFRGLRRYRMHIGMAGLFRNFTLLAVAPLIYVKGYDLLLVFYALGIGTAIATAAALWALRGRLRLKRPSRRARTVILRRLVRFSYLLFVWNVFQKLAGRGQILIGGMFLTAEGVGVVSVLMRFVWLLIFMKSAVNHTAPVEFARLNYLRDRATLEHVYQSLAGALLVASCVVGIGLLAQPAVLLSWLGDAVASQAWLLLPLVAAQVYNIGTGPAGHLLIACRQQPAILLVSVIGSIAQVGFSVMLIPPFGVAGAVASESLTIVVLTSLRLLFVSTRLRIRPLDTPLLRIATFGCLGVAISRMVSGSVGGMVGLTIGSLLGLTIFVGLVARWSGLSWARVGPRSRTASRAGHRRGLAPSSDSTDSRQYDGRAGVIIPHER